MDAGTIVALVGVVLMFISMAIGGVVYVRKSITAARDEGVAHARVAEAEAHAAHQDANAVRLELAGHKLHVAETYVTKAGMTEQTQQLMSAIKDVGAEVGQITQRIDRMIERQVAAE